MLATLNRIARILAATLAAVMILVLAAGVYTMIQPLSSIMASPWHKRVMRHTEIIEAIHCSARASDAHWPKPPATVKDAMLAIQVGVQVQDTASRFFGKRFSSGPIPGDMVDPVADCLVLLENGDIEVRDSEAVRKAVREEKASRMWDDFWRGRWLD